MIPRLTRWVSAAIAGALLAPSLAAGAAHAQTGDPVAAATTQLDQAQQAAQQAAQQVAQTNQQLANVQSQLGADQAKIAQLQAEIPVIKAQEAQIKAVLVQRAVALYESNGPLGGYDSYLPDPSLQTVTRQVLANDAAKLDHEHALQLAALEAQLAQSEAEVQTDQASLQQQQAQLNQLSQQETVQQALMNERVAAANAALSAARALGVFEAAGQQPVMGPSVLTGAQMAGWIRSQGYSPNIETTIDDLANTYIQEGSDENVRGDVAFAQAVVETGGFEAAPDNNYAGMGWCDSCSNGTSFPTPRDGVRAQIQHLLNYADPNSRASQLHHPLSPYWYGMDPATAANNFDTFFAKGWAPTWEQMGHGNWATDPNYSGKVLHIYAEMLAFAQSGG
ncbi:MAG TPA: glucosaminidase domain-containing protein [Acidimicrobiia bacterium]